VLFTPLISFFIGEEYKLMLTLLKTKIPKERCFLEGSYASPVCLSGKESQQMNKNMERWWNDIDWGKPKYSEKNMSQCYFVHISPGIEPEPQR